MHNLTATELHEAFITGKYTAAQITEYYLKRIAKHNNTLLAFISVYEEKALEQARHLDQKKKEGKPLGKLAGVPVAIKDNIHIENEKTTCASNFLKDYVALFHATATKKLLEQDAIILGKTNLDEFAMGSSSEYSCFGAVKNPWNLNHTPGGSSGGSAVATAARLAPISLGTDTGGSIRQPAAFTGTVGFKPTYGRVSRYGLVAFGSSFDQIGPFANSVEDIALAMEVIGGHCPKDSTSLPSINPNYTDEIKLSIQGKNIGVDFSLCDQLNEDAKKIFNQTIESLKSLGVNIIDISLPLLKYSVSVYYILATAEASTNLARFDGVGFSKRSEEAQTLEQMYELSKHDGFGPEVKRRIVLGTYVLSAGHQEAFYKQAQKVRTLMIQQFNEAFNNCDAIVMPTTPTPAFELSSIQDPLQMYLQDLFTINANLTGMPAVSIPCGFDQKNLPFAIQFITPQQEDARALRFAHHFEKHINLQDLIPETYR